MPLNRLLFPLAFVGCILGANWTLDHFGVWDVGGWAVPSGVLWIGLAFTLRDLTHEALGRIGVLLAIAAGVVLSLVVSPAFAVASAVAFGVSELADFAVYTPLRERRWLLAVAASGVVGLVLDSVLFLHLAFGSLDFLPGQLLGKGVVLAVTVAVLAVLRRRGTGHSVLPRHSRAVVAPAG